MKYRTISRVTYFKKARHRRGHGIHSPFLYHLISEVLENKTRLREYKIFKELKNNVFNLLNNFSAPSLSTIYHEFNLAPSNPRRLYRKVELPRRYGKVAFRLIREFKPASIISYGPTFGANLALIAMACKDSVVYQSINDPIYELASKEIIKSLDISNIRFFNENAIPSVKSEFILINYPCNPDISQKIVNKHFKLHGDDDVLIIRGIHESREMEAIWGEIVASENVRVSLDLFEIGIALFRKGLQKENFILRF
jgi:hypothetical protein